MTPVTITATDKEVTYSANGIAIPVNGMFTIPTGAGSATYSVTNGTGVGNFADGKLTVTKSGTFTVNVRTAELATHTTGAETSAKLNVKKATTAYTTTTNLTAIIGQTLNDVKLTDGWTWVDSTIFLNEAGEKTFDATFKPLIRITTLKLLKA